MDIFNIKPYELYHVKGRFKHILYYIDYNRKLYYKDTIIKSDFIVTIDYNDVIKWEFIKIINI